MIIAKVNREVLDWWTVPHFVTGYLFGRFTDMDLLSFTLLNTGFEVFEHYLKANYDIFNVPFGRKTVFEGAENTVADFFVTEGGYLLGASTKPAENMDLKEGCLYARLAHEAILLFCAENMGFNVDDTTLMLGHVMDPDSSDVWFDRFWRHFYDPLSGSGGAPQSCEFRYILAVNDDDLVDLARASHYLQDVGCVFHTTSAYQGYHVWYERWLDEHINEIQLMPYAVVVDGVAQAVKDLSMKTRERLDRVMQYINDRDYDNLLLESNSNLNDVVSYLVGLYTKFLSDIANNVKYGVPVEQGVNNLITTGLLVGVPFGLYHMKKDL